MNFKPSTRIPLYQLTNRKNSPQDIYEMIKKEVNRDDECGYWKKEEVTLPKHTKGTFKKSVGMLVFFKNFVNEFRP